MDEAVLREWTGAHARALRVALRMTVRDFATRLGVAPRTVAQWEARGHTIRPRPELQATLDTALSRASEDERTRFRLLLGGEPSGEGDDPTNRRQLLQGGLSATALAVLDGALQAVPVDAGDDLLTRLPAAYRRAEAGMRSDLLIRPVTAHLRLLRRLVADMEAGGRPTARLFGAVSETAGLAAWLYADLDERAQARRCYRLAITAAQRTGEPLLVAYMQGSYGQFATACGDARQGLHLIAAARKRMASWPPIAEVWFDVLTADAMAGAGEKRALAVLDQAEQRLARAVTDGPMWPWVYRFDEAKLAGYRAVAASRLGRTDLAEDAFRVAETIPRAPKQAAVAAVHRARALAAAGQTRTACALAVSALDNASRLGSHRGVHAVAGFRAGLPADAAPDATELDERLDAVYAGTP